jgi:hypothetical protein
MGNRPHDPAYDLLRDDYRSTPVVHRRTCYICIDMEFARMGLPLCSPCCQCAAKGNAGHIPADNPECDDCEHEQCEECVKVKPEENICTCDTPCCEADVGVGIITCGSSHCPTHGSREE